MLVVRLVSMVVRLASVFSLYHFLSLALQVLGLLFQVLASCCLLVGVIHGVVLNLRLQVLGLVPQSSLVGLNSGAGALTDILQVTLDFSVLRAQVRACKSSEQLRAEHVSSKEGSVDHTSNHLASFESP